ncbi:hypothetical protein PUN28_001673 [Cardiocondyla obscurior]|uniref:Ribosomal protein S14 n=1 Tax=Cardiocondyla obscurior TaxID=286306 RepID=A0AAW2GQM8_9HYME
MRNVQGNRLRVSARIDRFSFSLYHRTDYYRRLHSQAENRKLFREENEEAALSLLWRILGPSTPKPRGFFSCYYFPACGLISRRRFLHAKYRRRQSLCRTAMPKKQHRAITFVYSIFINAECRTATRGRTSNNFLSRL